MSSTTISAVLAAPIATSTANSEFASSSRQATATTIPITTPPTTCWELPSQFGPATIGIRKSLRRRHFSTHWLTGLGAVAAGACIYGLIIVRMI